MAELLTSQADVFVMELSYCILKPWSKLLLSFSYQL